MKAVLLTVLILMTTQHSMAQTYEPQNEQEQQTAFQQLVRDTQMKLFKANCVPVPQDVEPTLVCAEDHLWGLGGMGGWYCCQRPPT